MISAASTLLLAVQDELEGKVQVVAVAVTAVMLAVVLELVRRRRLAERYALLWMSVGVILLLLAIWNGLLSSAAHLVGIDLASNALFLAAIGVAFVLLLHFSVAISRLAEETKILAQEVARLDAELREARAAGANGGGPQPPDGGSGARPVDPSRRSASTADQ